MSRWFLSIAGLGAVVGAAVLARRENDRSYRLDVAERERLVADVRRNKAERDRKTMRDAELLLAKLRDPQ